MGRIDPKKVRQPQHPARGRERFPIAAVKKHFENAFSTAPRNLKTEEF